MPWHALSSSFGRPCALCHGEARERSVSVRAAHGRCAAGRSEEWSAVIAIASAAIAAAAALPLAMSASTTGVH